jgi:hypothetical protein
MRLSGLCLAFVLLSISLSFAQHHEAGSSSSAPASSPAPSPAPSFSPPPSSPAPSMMHSAPSAPAPVSIPETHFAPTPSASPSPTHNSMSSTPSQNAPEIKPQPGATQNPAAKSPSTGKIVSDDRTVETPAVKKPAESYLRHPVCPGGVCPEGAKLQNAQTSEDSLRRCILCKCPPGESPGKGGCVANPTNPTKTQTPCAAGNSWNGSSCVPTNEVCQAGQSWDGARCATTTCTAGKILRNGACMDDCSVFNARSAGAIEDVRSARRDRDDACRLGPTSPACQLADAHYQNMVAEYRLLLGGASAECTASLPLPETL